MIYDRNADTQYQSNRPYASAWDLFTQYPDLEKMYYYNPTIHASIKQLFRVCTKEDVLDLIHHLLVQNNNYHEMHMDAVKQGYYPKPQ